MHSTSRMNSSSAAPSMLLMQRRRYNNNNNNNNSNNTMILSYVSLLLLLLLLVPRNVDSVELSHHTTNDEDDDTTTKCHILSFFPFDRQATMITASSTSSTSSTTELLTPPLERWGPLEYNRVTASYLASAHLAVQHFNTKDSTIVPELVATSLLPPLREECSDISLSLDVISQNVNKKEAGAIVLDETRRHDENNNRNNLCAILGNYDPDIGRVVQPMSVSLDIPQVMYATLDPFLVSSKRETAVGMLPTILPRTTALARYINDSPNDILPRRQYVTMIYEEAYTSSYQAACFQEDSADKFGLISNKYQDDHLGLFPTQTLREYQGDILTDVKESGIKTIWFNKMKASSLVLTAELLHERNMLTDEYVYFFTSSMFPSDNIGAIVGLQKVDSPMDKLLRGGLFIDHLDPFRFPPADDESNEQDGKEDGIPFDFYNHDDPFLKLWESKRGNDDGESFINELVETYPEYPKELFEDLFSKPPAIYSSHLYDAIMAIGFGVCKAAADHRNSTTMTTTPGTMEDDNQGESSPSPSSSSFPFTRADITANTFTGASGLNQWGCVRGNRCPNNHRFGMYNIRAVPSNNNNEGNNDVVKYHTYEAKLTALLSSDLERWEKVEDNVYRDGTTTPPSIFKEALNNHYLSKSVRGFGLFLFASAVSLSLVGLICVYVFRNEVIMTRSQPFFLSIICIGSIVTSFSILTLSFDEGWTTTPKILNVACTITLWFFFIGQVLTFSALVCKMWRLDRVTQFRRGQNLSRGWAVLPLVWVMSVTVAVLTVWTIVDPFVWSREWISLIPAETYGMCQCDNFWAFFGPLMGILVVAQAGTVYFAWKTGDVHEDFSDTATSQWAMITQLEAWLVGVPLLAVLGNDTSADAVYLSRVLLIWIFSMSSVVIVVGQKMYRAFGSRSDQELGAKVHVTGLSGNNNNNNLSRADSTSIRGKLRMSSEALQPSSSDLASAETAQQRNRSQTMGTRRGDSTLYRDSMTSWLSGVDVADVTEEECTTEQGKGGQADLKGKPEAAIAAVDSRASKDFSESEGSSRVSMC